MRILLINVFSTLNKGDAAIAMSQIAAMRAAYPAAEVTVQSWNPETDATRLDCPVVGPFFDMVSERHPEWGKVRRTLHTANLAVLSLGAARLSRRSGRVPQLGLSAPVIEALQAFADADLVVSVGGNFLYAYPGRNAFSFLKHCHQLMAAQAAGKPVVPLAQSFGPLAIPWHRALLRRILNRCDAVYVREQLSVDFLRELGCRRPMHLVPDSAFLLEPLAPDAAERLLAGYGLPEGCPRIGLTVRDWDFPHSPGPTQRLEEYYRSMADAVDWMVETWGARAILLPQCISPDQDDRRCMRAVVQRVRHRDRTALVEDDLSPREIKGIAGRLDMFIGTRMHSNIFATAMGTPTFAIAYQPKTSGIMGMLGMERWTLPIEEVTAERLKVALAALWSERDAVRNQLTERVAELQSQARASIAEVVAAYAAAAGSGAEVAKPAGAAAAVPPPSG